MTRTLVTPLGRLAREGPVRLEAEGCAVLVALVDGTAYAVDDACRHRGTALSGGLLRDGVVTCPGHLWRYDVRTGERHDTLGDPLTAYPVEIVGDEVRVTVPDPVVAPSLREVLLAHAHAPHASEPHAAQPTDPPSRMRVPQAALEAGRTPLTLRDQATRSDAGGAR